jgi:hypothetical protein
MNSFENYLFEAASVGRISDDDAMKRNTSETIQTITLLEGSTHVFLFRMVTS